MNGNVYCIYLLTVSLPSYAQTYFPWSSCGFKISCLSPGICVFLDSQKTFWREKAWLHWKWKARRNSFQWRSEAKWHYWTWGSPFGFGPRNLHLGNLTPTAALFMQHICRCKCMKEETGLCPVAPCPPSLCVNVGTAVLDIEVVWIREMSAHSQEK